MTMELSKEEIKLRLIRLNNLDRLHELQKVTISKQKETIKLLRKENYLLRNINLGLKQALEDLTFQLKQMKEIVFKRKAKLKKEWYEEEDNDPSKPRDKDSYERPIPNESEVTKIIYHKFKKRTEVKEEKIFYLEDIPLDTKKIVEKHIVEIDLKSKPKISLPFSSVVLGDNIKMLVSTLYTEQRLSYSQIQKLFKLLWNLDISSGEISKILKHEAISLEPMKESILEEIRKDKYNHLDETGWNTQKEGRGFGWSITDSKDNSAYMLGESRGKGIAEELRQDSNSILISDNYPAYKHLCEHHQLCWAHLLRKFRDLALDLNQEQDYLEIKSIFKELKITLSKPDPNSKLEYFRKKLSVISEFQSTDPKPVQRVKKTLLENISKYLTCLKFPFIPLTNNPAERSLRHLVIKRKISFGSYSIQTARNFSILLTVLKYLLKNYPEKYFEKYREVRV